MWLKLGLKCLLVGSVVFAGAACGSSLGGRSATDLPSHGGSSGLTVPTVSISPQSNSPDCAGTAQMGSSGVQTVVFPPAPGTVTMRIGQTLELILAPPERYLSAAAGSSPFSGTTPWTQLQMSNGDVLHPEPDPGFCAPSSPENELSSHYVFLAVARGQVDLTASLVSACRQSPTCSQLPAVDIIVRSS